MIAFYGEHVFPPFPFYILPLIRIGGFALRLIFMKFVTGFLYKICLEARVS